MTIITVIFSVNVSLSLIQRCHRPAQFSSLQIVSLQSSRYSVVKNKVSPTRQAKGDSGKDYIADRNGEKKNLRKPDSVEGAVLLLQIVLNVVSLKMTVWSLKMKYKTTAERKNFGGLQKTGFVLSQTIFKDEKKNRHLFG